MADTPAYDVCEALGKGKASVLVEKVGLFDDRVDPYHDAVWRYGSQAVWRNVRELSVFSHRAKVNDWFIVTEQDRQEAQERLLKWRREIQLKILSAVLLYRTVTVEQLEVLVGERICQDRAVLVRDLWVLGVIDVGSFDGFARKGAALHPGSWLLRPSRFKVFDNLYAVNMSPVERWRVCCGVPWVAGGQFSRHNVLATELILRAAGLGVVPAVLGEPLTKVRDLLRAGADFSADVCQAWSRGDGALVRPDGVRVVFEICASKGWETLKKARRWAEVMTYGGMEAQGVLVVFVAVGNRWAGITASSITHEVKKAVSQAVRDYPGVAGRTETWNRIGFVEWETWFPERNQVSGKFFDLSVELYHPVEKWGRWESFLTTFSERDLSRFSHIVENAQTIAAAPWPTCKTVYRNDDLWAYGFLSQVWPVKTPIPIRHMVTGVPAPVPERLRERVTETGIGDL